MASIEEIRDPSMYLTTHQVFGEITLAEALEHIQRYNAHEPDFRTLWDFSDGSLPDAEGASLADLSTNFADSMQGVLHRPERLVALTTPRVRDFGVFRTWAVYAMNTNPGIEWQVFRGVEDALAWLMSHPVPTTGEAGR